MHTMAVDETTIQDATVGIRYAMVALNILLILTGVTLITLGAQINQHLSLILTTGRDLPKLWCMGIMPIAVGVIGIAVVVTKNRKLMVLWMAFSLIIVAGSYVFYILSGCLDIRRYGISIQVFGHCQEQDETCKCTWSEGNYMTLLSMSTCKNIRRTTVLYLSLMGSLVLCLTTVVICCVLGGIVGCCIQWCMPRGGDEEERLHTTIYGANIRPRPSQVYLPQYFLLPPNEASFVTERSASVTV